MTYGEKRGNGGLTRIGKIEVVAARPLIHKGRE
jgi:hypothetical protein